MLTDVTDTDVSVQPQHCDTRVQQRPTRQS